MMKYIAVIPNKYMEAEPKKYVKTRMLNKKQALEILGISPTNPIKNDVFEMLPKYDNPFNSQAIFREEDVIDLLRSFPVVRQDS